MALLRKHFRLIKLLVPDGYALLTYFLFRFVLPNSEPLSLSFLFFVPFTVGVLSLWYDTRQPPLYRYSLSAPAPVLAAQLAIVCVVLMLIKLETLICVAMAAPILAVSAILGGMVGCFLRCYTEAKPKLSLALLPFLLMQGEAQISAADDIHDIRSEMFIQAPPEAIWEQITSYMNIRPQEVPWSFAHNILQVPKPIGATLEYPGVGAVRKAEWEKNVYFDEVITRWEPQKIMSYRWKFYPDSFPRGTIDDYFEIGGKYMDVTEGGYELIPEGDGKTRVKLFTRYRSTTHFNFYTRWWAQALIDDFHMAVLTVMKDRLEAS